MKIAICFLLFLPLVLGAQDDYCPCMDKQNEVDEWDQFMLDLDQTMQEKTPEPQLIFVMTEERITEDRMSLPPDGEELTGVLEEELETMKTIVIQETTTIKTKRVSTTRKSPIKKRKKQYSIRVKSRKKFKKYKGGCPVF